MPDIIIYIKDSKITNPKKFHANVPYSTAPVIKREVSIFNVPHYETVDGRLFKKDIYEKNYGSPKITGEGKMKQ